MYIRLWVYTQACVFVSDYGSVYFMCVCAYVCECACVGIWCTLGISVCIFVSVYVHRYECM